MRGHFKPRWFRLAGLFVFWYPHPMDEVEPTIVTAQELASYFGVGQGKILEWYHGGVIPAEIAEGSTFRFNREKVSLILRHRAAIRAEDEVRSCSPASYFSGAPISVTPYVKPVPKPVDKDLQYLDPPPSTGSFMEYHKAKVARERREKSSLKKSRSSK